MVSKLSKSLRRCNRANNAALSRADKAAKRFAAIIRELEVEIKKELLAVFSRIRGLDAQSAQMHINLLLADISRTIERTLKNPLVGSGEILWSVDDASIIRKAIAMAVISGSHLGYLASRSFLGADAAKKALTDIRMVSQQAMAKRVRLLADAFDLSIKDWVFTHIQYPINIGRDFDWILGDVNETFQRKVSPFRVSGVQPETRAAMIGKGETILIGLGTLTALGALAKSINPDQKLFAQSVAIHDSKTGQDSLDAESMTSGWVEFPEPYLSMTEFRRRPNDRCIDVVVPFSDLAELGIEPEIDEES